MLQRQYAPLIGDREPIVLHGRLPGMGSVSRTVIRIGDDNRAPLDTRRRMPRYLQNLPA